MSFIKKYFQYVGESEAPNIYHRWTALSTVGTMLGRQVWIPFGHGKIYPNQYIMLMGEPGTRKGSAMNIGRKLLAGAGYRRFCPDRLSKEQFLMEIKPYDFEDLFQDADLENLILDKPSEIYAFAEEFTDLVGQGGMEFMTMLTKLWDNMDTYTHPKIHGKSVLVERPTVNIFGGNTSQGLQLAIPPEALGNGFLSRMIFIFAEPTERKITFPDPPNIPLRDDLIDQLKDIREDMQGEIVFLQAARKMLDRVYKEAVEIDDVRFKHYSTRRFIHLLKICCILAVCEGKTEVSDTIVRIANTYLVAAERTMSKALGEYGKGKYQDVTSHILAILNKVVIPMSLNDLFKKVGRDLARITELADIMRNLVIAERVQITSIGGKQGYISKHSEAKQWPTELVGFDEYLTPEEAILQ